MGAGEAADKGIFDLADGIAHRFFFVQNTVKTLEDTEALLGGGKGEIFLWLDTH